MSLSHDEIQRLTDISELSKLFPVSEEQHFLRKYLCEQDINECVSAGSTNLERMAILILKLIRCDSHEFYDGLVQYFLDKCQQYKKIYFKLKYGKSNIMEDSSTQTNGGNNRSSSSSSSYDLVLMPSACISVSESLKGGKDNWNESSVISGNLSSEAPNVPELPLVKLEESLEVFLTSTNYDLFNESHTSTHSAMDVTRDHATLDRPSFSAIGQNSVSLANPNHTALPTSEVKPFRCQICGKGFTRSVGLRVHMDLHKERKFQENSKQIPVVNTSVYSNPEQSLPQELLQTVPFIPPKRKDTDRTFQCLSCGKCFAVAAALTSHLLIHTGEKPFQCKLCGQHFRQKATLTNHMRTHAIEKPFRCKYCGRGFTRSVYLREHITIHQGAVQYRCSRCDQSFANRGAFTYHLRNAHSVSGDPAET